MTSFSKFVLIGVTALTAFASVAANATPDSDRRARNAQEVIAAHRQVPAVSPVVYHPRHRHHHRHHHVRRPVHHPVHH